MMRNITSILRRNRRIIRELLNGKIVRSLHKTDLIAHGFQPDYHTHSIVDKCGNRTFYCFEFGYKSLPDNNFKLFIQN